MTPALLVEVATSEFQIEAPAGKLVLGLNLPLYNKHRPSLQDIQWKIEN